MPDNQTLKPCPFCGAKPVDTAFKGQGVGFVESLNPTCYVRPFVSAHTKDETYERWNFRFTDRAAAVTDTKDNAPI